MFSEEELTNVFELLARVAQGVVATVGPDCEVVVHDLRDPEHTVVAISGNLTHRFVGAPVPSPDLLPDRVDQYKRDVLLDRMVTPFGKELLASTIWVRDTSGHIVGALCINMDFSNLIQARDLLNRSITSLLGSNVSETVETFATTVDDFVQIALRGILADTGKPRHQLDRDDKIRIVRELDQTGVFSLRGAVDSVAAELGVSRGSIYAYLKGAREDAPSRPVGVASGRAGSLAQSG